MHFSDVTLLFEQWIIFIKESTVYSFVLEYMNFKVPLAIYLTKNKNTILLIIKPFKLVKTFKKRNKIGLSARITI
jgi:hypothetical protein